MDRVSKPYREQKIALLCVICGETAVRVCPGCGRPFCGKHAPPRLRGCSECEAAYEVSQVRWAPGGWLGFVIIIGGVAVTLVALSLAFSSTAFYTALETGNQALWVLLGGSAFLVVLLVVSIVLAKVVPRRVFFSARRRKLAEPDAGPPGLG